MSDFQWGDSHIDWFSRTFANIAVLNQISIHGTIIFNS
jgi:hypothetical protein